MLLTYLRVLACVTRADGTVAEAERAAIELALHRMDVAGAVRDEVALLLDTSHPIDVEATLASAVAEVRSHAPSPGAVMAEIVRDCYVIAAADGDVTGAEVALIDRFLALAGVPENGRATLHEWAEAAARETVEGMRLFAESVPD